MPNTPRVAVCIDSHTKTNVLLRAAKNKANELGVPWYAIYIETPEHYQGDRDERTRILRFLTHAEKMGAEIHHLEDKSVFDGILHYIDASYKSKQPIRHLIMGQSSKEGFFSEIRASLAEKVTRRLRKYATEVQIIPLSGRQYKSSWFDRLQFSGLKLHKIAFALMAVLVAYLASELLRSSIPQIEWKIQNHNITAFFLIASVVTSLRHGLIPGLISAIAGFSTINYFYFAPIHKFGFLHAGDGLNLSIFLLSAVVVSFMGAYSSATQTALMRKAKRSQALYKVHRLASEATERDEALTLLHEELTKLLEMDVAFFMPPAMNPSDIQLVHPKEIDFNEIDRKSLLLCWEDVRTTGLGTLNLFNTQWRFEPLSTPDNEIGVMAIRVPAHIHLDPSFGRLMSALADQAASILERIELTKMMSESRMREEREKLRSMLLSSVSHDLKTPLASIIGSLSVYKRMRKGDRLDVETADELTETALSEAQRLDSFISNILDMTRIESGDITFDKEWVDVCEPVQSVQRRLRQRLMNHEFVFEAPKQELEIAIDIMMTEQVLQNIIDNAAKYSPVGGRIILSGQQKEGGFCYMVRDFGPGIPDDKREAVFDKYERLKHSDSKVAGTGLGLAISKAVMEKIGGKITVDNHEEGGAVFTLWFPEVRLRAEDKGEE